MAVSKSLALNAMFPAFFALLAAALSTIFPLLISLLSEVHFHFRSWLCHISFIVKCYFWLLTRDWSQQQNAIDPGQDPMVFLPRGNFKSTSICQTALSSQVCKESANLQIYSRSPCPRLIISAFCKNVFCRSTAISFDRCWAAGKTTFWVWRQKLNRLNIITWKCSEQKTSFERLLAKTILIFNQLGFFRSCPTLSVWLLTGVRRTRYKGRLAIVLLTIHPIGALFNCSTKHTVMDLYLFTIIINTNNTQPFPWMPYQWGRNIDKAISPWILLKHIILKFHIPTNIGCTAWDLHLCNEMIPTRYHGTECLTGTIT